MVLSTPTQNDIVGWYDYTSITHSHSTAVVGSVMPTLCSLFRRTIMMKDIPA